MLKLRYSLVRDGLFYLFVVSYGYLIVSMTARLWFGDGVNIFATYSDAQAADLIVDANKVYWAKSSFLYATVFLYALNFDYRAAVGIGGTLWSGALMLMFGPSMVLLFALGNGVALFLLQAVRGQIWSGSGDKKEASA